MYPMRWNRTYRRGMLLGLAAIAGSTGCASMKLPFGNKDLASAPKESRFSAVSNAGAGITGQFKSMGTAVSSAMGKAKSAVTSTFSASSSAEASDETSLANMPSKLGPEIWVTNGQLYETQGNYAKALDNYTKALELEPNNESALLSTARLYARQGQHDKAADFYNKAIAVSPQSNSYNELALIYQKLGKSADAQASISKAIELEPSNARYRNNLASMLVSGGRSDEAVKQLEQVFPPAIANYNVAYLHFNSNNYAAAQQHLQLALQADPNLQEARNLMSKLSGSQTAQAAVSTYNSANQIYQTAQAVMGQSGGMQQTPYAQAGMTQAAPPAAQTPVTPPIGYPSPSPQSLPSPQASMVPPSPNSLMAPTYAPMNQPPQTGYSTLPAPPAPSAAMGYPSTGSAIQ